jgi:hypothetical protein
MEKSIFNLDSVFNYDLVTMTKDLQKILKIEDWKVEVQIVDKYGMEEAIEDRTVLGCCYRNRRSAYARVSLNKDHEEINDWFSTLLHELYHVVTDDYCTHVDFLFDNFNCDSKEHTENLVKIYYERLMDNLSKGMAVVLGFEFIEKYRRVDNGTTTKTENA